MEKKKNKHKIHHNNSFFSSIKAIYGLYKYIHSLSHEGTDAQIEKNMNLLYLEFLVM
jgi:membrane fusion protein (multidrug efflux system)